MDTTVIKRRLYLADREVTAKDVYIKHDFSKKTAENLDTSEHHENQTPTKKAEGIVF
ncbi:hypothetical protein KQ236_15715 [Lactococcus lactis]|nr:hypothetical protein [Lactococcus lactis]